MSNKSGGHTFIKEIGFTLLAEGKSIKVRADGYSMFPSIKSGSMIYIEPLSPGSYPAPGEIVAWKRESGFVVHRLVRIIKEGSQILFMTRGDSCPREDKPVAAEKIAGRVVRIEDSKGKVIKGNQSLNYKPNYFFNRLLVSGLFILKKIY
jgi:signal peptidase I